jgi:hypothetical protein
MITYSSDVKSILVKYLEGRLDRMDLSLYYLSLDAVDEYDRGRCTEQEASKFASFIQGMEYGLRVAKDVVDHLHCINCGEQDYKPTGAEFEDAVSDYLEAIGGDLCI